MKLQFDVNVTTQKLIFKYQKNKIALSHFDSYSVCFYLFILFSSVVLYISVDFML